jgi:ABC-2 type transport system ATP-binding protein
MGSAVDVCSATIRFGAVQAVERLTLRVAEGEVFGLLGPNGSGKTSLIRALCGLLPLDGGVASVLGYDVARSAEEIRAQTGYMSQKFGLYEDLTARENMAFYGGIYGLSSAVARERQRWLVGLTGLGPYLDRRAARLSGGWKQRLALVCALLHGPRLLFLDEPTAGVDPVARRELWDLLFRLAGEGTTLFVTTHYMDEAERCGRVGYLHLGHLLAVGTPRELKDLPAVSPAGTRRLEVLGGHSAELARRLRGREGVREVTVFGQALHVLVDADGATADLGLGGAAVRPMEPTLEDVFVALSRVPAEAGA